MRRGWTRPHGGSGRPCRCCQTQRDKIVAGERARVRVELQRARLDRDCLECDGEGRIARADCGVDCCSVPCMACCGGGA